MTVVDVVWNAWKDNLSGLARGWAGVRLDRAVGYWHDGGTPWEAVSLQTWPSHSGEPVDLFRATFTGSVRLDISAKRLSWQLVAEWIHETKTLRRETADLSMLDETSTAAAAERAAADIAAWLRVAHQNATEGFVTDDDDNTLTED